MDSAMARRAATNLLKRVGQNASRHPSGFSRHEKGRAFQSPAMPLEPSDPPISSDDDDVDMPARRPTVKLRIGKPLCQHSGPDIQNSAHAPSQQKFIPELSESSHSLRRSSRHSAAKEIKTAAVDTHRLSNAG